jgi:ribosomal protein S18 acetylase RimI-like enzyme
VRSSRAEDIDGALAILHARDVLEVGGHDATAGWIEDAWRSPRVDVDSDTRVVEAPDGELAAYADVTHIDDPEYVTSWAPVHPAHQGLGIGTALLGWIEARAARLPARALHQHVDGGDATGQRLLERAGYRVVRTHLHMIRDLADPAPASPRGDLSVAIRPMHDGEERRVHHVVAASFAEHFALTVEPFDVWWGEWCADPLYDRDLFLVAEDPGAGIVGVACDFEDAGVGWVGDLGVLPAYRGRGIATALLAASFDAFAARGIATARLNVDAENETGAADLYWAVGMREHRRFLVFEKPLRDEG